MRHRSRCVVLILGLLSTVPNAGQAIAAIPRPEVERAVADVRAALARDGGALWGVRLEGPILFVDAATREVVATDPDSAGVLKPEGALFAGTMPAQINVANTALRWNGRLWSMVLWPIPTDTLRRRTLLIHELWHRVQDDLGLPAAGPSNAHLDQPDGRLWLQLEWRALARALAAAGDARREAIADALAFRAVRRARFPGSAAEEEALERHEGLAEYTGVRLASWTPPARGAYARGAIAQAPQLATFVRSFAYVSGPAYGLLLDDARPGWRRELSGGVDLGELLRAGVPLPEPDTSVTAAERRAARYGRLDSLRIEETTREQSHQLARAALRSFFVGSQTLRLPLRSPKLSFDPRGLRPLDSLGTVYGNLRITESWGILEAPEGGLIAPDWTAVTVFVGPASGFREFRPEAWRQDTLRGVYGWKLVLDPAWEVRPDSTTGSLRVTRR